MDITSTPPKRRNDLLDREKNATISHLVAEARSTDAE